MGRGRLSFLILLEAKAVEVTEEMESSWADGQLSVGLEKE